MTESTFFSQFFHGHLSNRIKGEETVDQSSNFESRGKEEAARKKTPKGMVLKLETNIFSENRPLEREIPIGNLHF